MTVEVKIGKDPIRVGIAGLGRSGWNIHARTLKTMGDRYTVTAVADGVADRRTEAVQALGCRAYAEFEDLLADDRVDLIIVATPNYLHSAHTILALESGRHVVCEKPFALTVVDADRMIQTAEVCERVLAPFQNRRYEAHFLKVRELIDSGALGQIVQIRMNWHQFTRRWDWQSLRKLGGGQVNNNGSHLLDQALELFGPEDPHIFADLRRVLSPGDAEDHMKIVLVGDNAPTIDIELTNVSGYPQDRWHIMGTAGALRGSPEHLEWKTVDWSELPERHVSEGPADGRAYPHEDIPWVEHEWRRPADTKHEYVCFYEDLYETIRNGQPVVITPQSVRRMIRLQETCHQLCEV